MSDALLDPQEMEAIQAAIRETAPRRSSAAALDAEATRLALIVDDRAADAARPILLGLATRAARLAMRMLRPHLSGDWQLDVIGVEIVDGLSVKEELRGCWVAGASAGDDVELVIAAQGGVIELAAAKRCGSARPATEATRAPSSVALRLFQPTGRAIVDSWIAAWREAQSSELVASNDLGIVSRLIDARTAVRVALAFGGAASGRIQVYARPDRLAPRPNTLAAYKADAARIAAALANVPVELVAELGTLRLTLAQLRRLAPSATMTLHGFVDSRVPIYCGGVLKAWARPVVCRGVLAVQIESVVHSQGERS
jgi:flagellar motor switch/type III secretory pathway protein FliN